MAVYRWRGGYPIGGGLLEEMDMELVN